ncbi:MAG TPA: ABC transporter permease [Gemmatimonadaceae bacterium]|nr:ABC transporter permease [Gemmatimonadaceae bacterium]
MGFRERVSALAEGVFIAFDAMRQNKVRAALTIAGIAIGVIVVTAMSAAVHGINAGVEEAFAAAGPTTFYVTKWPIAINNCNGPETCPWIRFPPLRVEEAAQVARLPTIKAVTAHVNSSAAVKYKDRTLPGAQLEAYTPGWTDVDGGSISPGRSFTDAENADGAQVALVDDKIAERLFAGGDALDKTIALDGRPFRVIGVYHESASFFDNSSRGRVVIPFETARRRLSTNVRWLDLTVKPRDGVPQDEAMDDAVTVLRTVRGLRPGQADNFFVSTQEKVMELYNSIFQTFFLVMIALSAIGLLVGGVGVVAIMMISVTERTREIGVRKALGATRRIILWQFLVEAVTLTGIGAVIGLLLGGGATGLVRLALPIKASIPPFAIVAALAASCLTGILFGMIPALRASRLDPVEALRYE